jgi:hypothetical protein
LEPQALKEFKGYRVLLVLKEFKVQSEDKEHRALVGFRVFRAHRALLVLKVVKVL